jgi:vancomycin resistance protein YoaR
MTTITTALTRTGSFMQPGPARRAFLIGFFATLAAGISLLLAASIGVGLLSAGRVMPGVSVAGVDVSGLDRSAAEAALRADLPSMSTGELTLLVDGDPIVVPFADLGRGYRLDVMIDSAFAVGRSGNPVADIVGRLRTLTHASSIAPVAASDDPAALETTVAGLVAQSARTPVDASVAYTPGRGFVVTPGVEGAQLDGEALRSALLGAVTSTDAANDEISVETLPIVPRVTTLAAQRAAEQAERMGADSLALRAGGKAYDLPQADLAALISFQVGADGAYLPVVDRQGLVALIEPLAGDVAQAPKNAAFEWGASGVTDVVPGVDGLELDVNGSVASVIETLQARAHHSVRRAAALAVAVTTPALSTEAALAAADEMVRLPGGTWTTYFVPGDGNYWGKNITIPAHDLDGYVIAPGEWFSFWDGIGPVTLEHGYGYGGAILGGRSVANGALAGGICSTSTTLFNAAMRAGLEIGDRTNHSYYIERYPVGLDATVLKTDTWATDMTFRNDTEFPIVIRSSYGSGFVRFDIWGVPDGRTVSLTKPVTSNHRQAKETTVVNASLKPGTRKRVEYMHNGFDAVVSRTVRDADGAVLHGDTWVSHYRTVNGITEVGPAPAATPTPTASPQPSSPPPSSSPAT